jgi:hypothetical protein
LPPFEDRESGSHFAILSRHQPATQKSCNTSDRATTDTDGIGRSWSSQQQNPSITWLG